MARQDQCCTEETLYSTLKYSLLLYNFIFLLLGFSLIGLGIYAEVMRSELTEVDHVFLTPSVFLFSLGFVASMFAMTGFVAALRDNLFLLRMFIGSVIICIVLEMGAGIAALVFKDPAKNFVNKYVLKGLVTYYDDQDLKNVVDYVQEEFECCGGRLYLDWEINQYHNCSSPGPAACGVPYSCCLKDPSGDLIINSMCGYETLCIKKSEAVQIIYLSGCIDAVLDFLWMNLDLLAGLLLGIFIPQLTGIILGVLYLDTVKRIINKWKRLPESEASKQLPLISTSNT